MSARVAHRYCRVRVVWFHFFPPFSGPENAACVVACCTKLWGTREFFLLFYVTIPEKVLVYSLPYASNRLP